MSITQHLDKFRLEHDKFIASLADELNCAGDEQRAVRALRAVLHTLRDRITVQQSLHVISQLPEFLKLYYIENWKFREKPVRYSSIEDFAAAVKLAQIQLGETQFDCDEKSGELANIVLASLRKYLDDGSIQDIFSELPNELHSLFM